MVDDLRIELRARNNILWHAIFDSHASVSDFCAEYGMSQGEVGGLLNLTYSPYRKRRREGSDGHLRVIALRLASITGIAVDELFPYMLYEITDPEAVIELPTYRFVQLSAARHVALPATQHTDMEVTALSTVVRGALAKLQPREAQVLRLRYGLDGEEPMTFSQVAHSFGVTGGRIRQIESTAMRKLRRRNRYKAR